MKLNFPIQKSLDSSNSSNSQKTSTVQKLAYKAIEIIFMFGACLVVCHSPKLVYELLSHSPL
jgi:hypothetical protein